MKELMEKAQNEFAKRNYQKAKQMYQEIILNEPENVLARQELARTLLRLKNYIQAFNEATQVLKLNSKQSEAHNVRAYVYYLRKNWEEAKKECIKSLDINPKLVYPNYLLGMIYFQQGQYQESREFYERTLKLSFSHAEAHMGLGNLFAKSKQWENAYSEYKLALHYNPALKNIRLFLSITWLRKHLVLFSIFWVALIVFSFLKIKLLSPVSFLLVFLFLGGLSIASFRLRQRFFGFICFGSSLLYFIIFILRNL